MLSYNQYGLPLQIFNDKCKFIPIFSLNELDIFDKNTGFLAGTTNQLFLNFPKSRADLIINIDKDQFIYETDPKEKKMKPKLKLARSHTFLEKVYISQVISLVSYMEDE